MSEMSEQLDLFTYQPTPSIKNTILDGVAAEKYVQTSVDIIIQDARDGGNLLSRQDPEEIRRAANIVMDCIWWDHTPEGQEQDTFWHEVYDRLKLLARASARARRILLD